MHLKTDFPQCPLSGLLIKRSSDYIYIFYSLVLKDEKGKTGLFCFSHNYNTAVNHIQIQYVVIIEHFH